MKSLLLLDGSSPTQYDLIDPGGMSETEFEYHTVRALSAAFPDHRCILFSGRFEHEEAYHKPDLALVANDFSHWFVIEVELSHHSFMGHVIPQVLTFRYGNPEPDCESSLARQLDIPLAQASRLLRDVPMSVAVVVNAYDRSWKDGLVTHGIQYMVARTFSSPSGEIAVELDGDLYATRENLGFGNFSATDSAIRLPLNCLLADGVLQIESPEGALADWRVQRDSSHAWLIKVHGRSDIPDQSRIQLIRSNGQRVSMKVTN